jgi:hypothetical protein
MGEYTLASKSFDIPKGASVDDVADMVRFAMSQPINLERVIIEDKLKIEFWEHNVKKEPPFGDLPEELNKLLSQTLSKAEIVEVDKYSSSSISTKAMATVTTMLLEASRRKMVGIAWVFGNGINFSQWVGIQEVPKSFLGLPTNNMDALPPERIILICGRSRVVDPLQGEIAILASMEG